MQNFIRLFIAVLACFICFSAFAEDEAWPEGSAMAVGLDHVKTRDYFKRLLEKKHSELITLIEKEADSRLVDGLKQQHTAWLAYQEKECEVFGASTGAGGSWPSTYAVECEARVIEHRFKRVRAAVECIRKLPEEKRKYELSQCIQQILPFNFKGQ
jgi:hypothetical protein